MRGIELTPEQRARLLQKERALNGKNRAAAMEAQRQARLARIKAAQVQAEALLNTLDNHHTNHIAAAMLYFAEGAKAEGAFAFGNSNPRIIRYWLYYWLYLLRTSFDIDESKFRIQILTRADQDAEELLQYWSDVTNIKQFIKGHADSRTAGKPTRRPDYKGVCIVHYYDISIRRYLDALAHALMTRGIDSLANGKGWIPSSTKIGGICVKSQMPFYGSFAVLLHLREDLDYNAHTYPAMAVAQPAPARKQEARSCTRWTDSSIAVSEMQRTLASVQQSTS